MALLNNTPTQDVYTTAVQTIFTKPRPSFSLNVTNAAVVYQLMYIGADQVNTRDITTESLEHFIPPSFNRFSNPEGEGLPEGSRFAGIRIRSAVIATPARVTVI